MIRRLTILLLIVGWFAELSGFILGSCLFLYVSFIISIEYQCWYTDIGAAFDDYSSTKLFQVAYLCSLLVYFGRLFVLRLTWQYQIFVYTVCSEVGIFIPVATPQDIIIDQLESDIERLKLEIFELKGDNKLLKMQLKECATKLQEQQGYYDDDGNYVE